MLFVVSVTKVNGKWRVTFDGVYLNPNHPQRDTRYPPPGYSAYSGLIGKGVYDSRSKAENAAIKYMRNHPFDRPPTLSHVKKGLKARTPYSGRFV